MSSSKEDLELVTKSEGNTDKTPAEEKLPNEMDGTDTSGDTLKDAKGSPLDNESEKDSNDPKQTSSGNGGTNPTASDKCDPATVTPKELSAVTPDPTDNSSTATDAKTTPDTETDTAQAAPPEATADKMNPYSYTSRGEFTSENFKIEVRNMPRYYGVSQFKKFLTNTLKLNVHKMKPLPGRGAGIFVTLHDEPTRQEALKLLNGREWKKAKLSARPASAIPDPLLTHRQKRGREEGDGGGGGGADKKPRQEAPLSQRTRDAVVPWWNVPYDEQLRRKRSHVWGVLAEYKRSLRKQNFPLFKWMDKKENTVTVEPVRPSPETECYRNKCEFYRRLPSRYGRACRRFPSGRLPRRQHGRGAAGRSPARVRAHAQSGKSLPAARA